MIDKGPDTSNPLALIGSAVLGSFGTWVASMLFRKKHGPEDDEYGGDDDVKCATKGELRAARAQFAADLRLLEGKLGGDIAYVRESMDRLSGTVARLIRGEISHGGD